jgi:hypothetical protein
MSAGVDSRVVVGLQLLTPESVMARTGSLVTQLGNQALVCFKGLQAMLPVCLRTRVHSLHVYISIPGMCSGHSSSIWLVGKKV